MMSVEHYETAAEAAHRLYEEGLTLVPLGSPFEAPPRKHVERCKSLDEAREKWPKTPRIAWHEYQTQSVPEETMQGWLRMWPDANWAVLTGKEIVVIDADSADAMAWVESGAITRTTRTVSTAKGKHYYYQRNKDLEIRNSVGKCKVDIRGFGGYVVAPGSVHATGVVYTEHTPPGVDCDWRELPMLGAGDLAAINAYNGGGASTVDGQGNLNFTAQPVFTPGAPAPEGQRNNALAQNVGSYIRAGMSLHEIMNAARTWNDSLSAPLAAGEVERTAVSVVQTHLRKNPGANIPVQPLPELTPQPEPSSFFLSADDVMAGADKPLPYIVRHYLLLDSLALIFGAPGSGKSMVALDMAICIALGIEWHGQRVKQGPVIYIAGEGQHGIGRRLMAWQLQHGQALRGAPLYFSRQSAAIYDRFAAEQLTAAVDLLVQLHGHDPVLIVIDTLARNFGAGDENATKDMNQFIQHVEALLQKRFGACVLIVHHTSKGDKSEARGNGALKGAIDTEFSVMRDETGAVVVQAGKIKDGPTPNNKHFDLAIIELPITPELDHEPETSVVLVPRAQIDFMPNDKPLRQSNQGNALAVLRNLYAISRNNLEAQGRDPSEANVETAWWRKATDMPRNRFNEVVKALAKAGRIEINAPHVRLIETNEHA